MNEKSLFKRVVGSWWSVFVAWGFVGCLGLGMMLGYHLRGPVVVTRLSPETQEKFNLKAAIQEVGKETLGDRPVVPGKRFFVDDEKRTIDGVECVVLRWKGVSYGQETENIDNGQGQAASTSTEDSGEGGAPRFHSLGGVVEASPGKGRFATATGFEPREWRRSLPYAVQRQAAVDDASRSNPDADRDEGDAGTDVPCPSRRLP